MSRKFWFSLGSGITANVQRAFVFWWLQNKIQSAVQVPWPFRVAMEPLEKIDWPYLWVELGLSVIPELAGDWLHLAPKEKGMCPTWQGDDWISEWREAGKTPGSCMQTRCWWGTRREHRLSPISVVTLHKDNVTQMLWINNSENKKYKKPRHQ